MVEVKESRKRIYSHSTLSNSSWKVVDNDELDHVVLHTADGDLKIR